MTVDPDTYVALGFLAATITVTLGLFGYITVKQWRKRTR